MALFRKIFTSGDLLKMTESVRNDIEFILENSMFAGTLLDELSLLRIALRAYLDGAEPGVAIAWAAGKISDTITQTNDHGRPNKKP